MATADEDIKIELDEPTAEAPEVVIEPAEKTVEAKPQEPDAALETLKRQLEDERSGRTNAERQAQEARQDALRARGEVQSNQLQMVTSAIDTLKQNKDILKSQLREAHTVGDYDRVAEIQDEMAGTHAKLLQLEAGKDSLERQPKPQEAQRQNDPVESFASQLSAPSAAWVRRNPQFAREPKKTQAMIAAHNLAMSEDIDADTPEYFDFIETTLKLRKPETATVIQEDPTAQAAQVTQRRAAPPEAPVSRSGNGTGGRPNTVRLSAEEREIAQMNGMTDQEWAKAKLALQKEGRLN